MSNLAVSATTTPYAVVRSTTGSSSSTTVSSTSSATPKTVTSSTTPSSSTTANQTVSVATSSNTATLSSSTTYAYGSSASNSISRMVSSTTVYATSSSTTPNVTSRTLERNGGYITIYSSSSATPSVTSSSTTPSVSSSSTTLPPGTLERNGGYITILTSSSTTPNISSGDTTLSTGATSTPPAPGFDVNKIDYSYSSMIEEIDNQIRALAYDSALKHEDPDGAKAKLAELQAMRQQIYQETSIRNSIFFGVTENIEYEEFSFTREEEKAFDLMVQENIMEFISQDKYSNDAWFDYTREEKEMCLMEVFDYASKQLGVTVDGIVFKENISSIGSYDRDKNIIVIDEECMGSWSDNGTIKTLVHEMRHAYQWAATENPDLYVVSDKTRAVWAENLKKENYLIPSENEESVYRAQPIEWDAANFAMQSNNINKAKKATITYEGSWEIE